MNFKLSFFNIFNNKPNYWLKEFCAVSYLRFLFTLSRTKSKVSLLLIYLKCVLRHHKCQLLIKPKSSTNLGLELKYIWDINNNLSAVFLWITNWPVTTIELTFCMKMRQSFSKSTRIYLLRIWTVTQRSKTVLILKLLSRVKSTFLLCLNLIMPWSDIIKIRPLHTIIDVYVL